MELETCFSDLYSGNSRLELSVQAGWASASRSCFLSPCGINQASLPRTPMMEEIEEKNFLGVYSHKTQKVA